MATRNAWKKEFLKIDADAEKEDFSLMSEESLEELPGPVSWMDHFAFETLGPTFYSFHEMQMQDFNALKKQQRAKYQIDFILTKMVEMKNEYALPKYRVLRDKFDSASQTSSLLYNAQLLPEFREKSLNRLLDICQQAKQQHLDSDRILVAPQVSNNFGPVWRGILNVSSRLCEGVLCSHVNNHNFTTETPMKFTEQISFAELKMRLEQSSFTPMLFIYYNNVGMTRQLNAISLDTKNSCVSCWKKDDIVLLPFIAFFELPISRYFTSLVSLLMAHMESIEQILAKLDEVQASTYPSSDPQPSGPKNSVFADSTHASIDLSLTSSMSFNGATKDTPQPSLSNVLGEGATGYKRLTRSIEYIPVLYFNSKLS